MTTISNSEAQEFVACKRRWFYGYKRGLAERRESLALQRGTEGHRVLAHFYQTGEIIEPSNKYDDEKHEPLQDIIQNYFEHEPYASHGWEPVLVEKQFRTDMDGWAYNWTADLIMKNRAGKLVLIDHKFVGEFYKEAGLMMNMQAPRYVAAARVEGYEILAAEYNMLRTKPWLKTHKQGDRLRQERIPMSNTRVLRAFDELDVIEMEIEQLHASEDADMLAVRTASEYTCQWCPFRQLCQAELNEQNATLIEKTYYTKRAERYEQAQ